MTHKDRQIAQREAKLAQRSEVVAELLQEHVQLKKSLGNSNGVWVPHNTRDEIVDYVAQWSQRADIAAKQIGETA